MSYTFKSIADVELLNTMPENANSIIEVAGALKRGPKVDVVNELVNVEALASVPEQATILAEVEGNIKRIPGKGLGGGWDFIIGTDAYEEEFFWIKGNVNTLIEALLSGTPPTICVYSSNGETWANVISIISIEFWQGSGFGLILTGPQDFLLEVHGDGSIEFVGPTIPQ